MPLLYSFVVDFCVYKVAKEHSFAAADAVVALAGAWPMLVLMTRPFSNALETVLFSLLLWLCFRRAGRPTPASVPFEVLRGALIGVVCAVGLFTRFTFAAFALVPLLYYAAEAHAQGGVGVLLRRVVLVGAVFAQCAVRIAIDVDTKFFGTFDPVLTPVASLLYNTDVANLAQHGLHPRVTHTLVNMPLLFAPLLVGALVALLGAPSVSRARRWLWSMVVVSLAVLSTAPHQEARFLLPLLPVVALLGGASLLRTRVLLLAGVAANALLFVFMGVAHQGGWIQALELFSGSHTPTHVYFWHVYDVPQYPLLQPHSARPPLVDVRTVAAGNGTFLRTAIQQAFGEHMEARGGDVMTPAAARAAVCAFRAFVVAPRPMRAAVEHSLQPSVDVREIMRTPGTIRALRAVAYSTVLAENSRANDDDESCRLRAPESRKAYFRTEQSAETCIVHFEVADGAAYASFWPHVNTEVMDKVTGISDFVLDVYEVTVAF